MSACYLWKVLPSLSTRSVSDLFILHPCLGTNQLASCHCLALELFFAACRARLFLHPHFPPHPHLPPPPPSMGNEFIWLGALLLAPWLTLQFPGPDAVNTLITFWTPQPFTPWRYPSNRGRGSLLQSHYVFPPNSLPPSVRSGWMRVL